MGHLEHNYYVNYIQQHYHSPIQLFSESLRILTNNMSTDTAYVVLYCIQKHLMLYWLIEQGKIYLLHKQDLYEIFLYQRTLVYVLRVVTTCTYSCTYMQTDIKKLCRKSLKMVWF